MYCVLLLVMWVLNRLLYIECFSGNQVNSSKNSREGDRISQGSQVFFMVMCILFSYLLKFGLWEVMIIEVWWGDDGLMK